MRRRDFLYNAGLLFPAVLLSPSLAMASEKIIDSDVLIIDDKIAVPDHVTTAINGLRVKTRQIAGNQISRFSYSKNGFLIVMNDDTTYRTQKMVVHSSHRLHASKSSVEIKAGDKSLELYLAFNDNNIASPEFWFLRTQKFDSKKAEPFLKRNKHAIMCLS
jgi:hypothetical protein